MNAFLWTMLVIELITAGCTMLLLALNEYPRRVNYTAAEDVMRLGFCLAMILWTSLLIFT